MRTTLFSTLLALIGQGVIPDCSAAEWQERSEAGRTQSQNPAGEVRRVIINRVLLSNKEVAALEQKYRVRMVDGAYWYDRATGAWGIEGGPTLSFVLPGVDMGGPLRADASNGNTGVFINGRELHVYDVSRLQQLNPAVPVVRGRYWVDAMGNCGVEGGPAFVNLIAVARSRGQAHYGKYGVVGADGNGTPFWQGRDSLGRISSFYR